jgi:hypothetical protein
MDEIDTEVHQQFISLRDYLRQIDCLRAASLVDDARTEWQLRRFEQIHANYTPQDHSVAIQNYQD